VKILQSEEERGSDKENEGMIEEKREERRD